VTDHVLKISYTTFDPNEPGPGDKDPEKKLIVIIIAGVIGLAVLALVLTRLFFANKSPTKEDR
jgi:hypothetical protein